MGATLAISLAVLAVGIGLCSPQVRSYLTMIALRRFFDKHMQRPRYRVYNLRPEEPPTKRSDSRRP